MSRAPPVASVFDQYRDERSSSVRLLRFAVVAFRVRRAADDSRCQFGVARRWNGSPDLGSIL